MTFWKAPKDAGCLLPRERVLWLGFGTFSPTPDLREGKIEFLSPEVIDLIDCTCNKASRKPTGDGKLLPSIKIPFYFLEGRGSENGFFTTTPSDCVLCIFYYNKNPRILKCIYLVRRGGWCTWGYSRRAHAPPTHTLPMYLFFLAVPEFWPSY